MSSWQTEKDRLAKLEASSRRGTEYHGQVALTDIPTWRKYFEDNRKTLAEKVSEKDQTAFANRCHPNLPPNSDASNKVCLFRGDITKLEIDAIVNAANSSLLGGGGVDGAIHRAAGGLLKEECRTLNGCKTGDAKITCGYKLPSKYVIHTVGPNLHNGDEPGLLKKCYDNCLALMTQHNLKSIAFPCISTGVYGYDSAKACPVALDSVKKFLDKNGDQVDRIIFCLFMPKDVEIYEQQMQLFFPGE